MYDVVSFFVWLMAHAAVSFLALYASDVEESPEERELRDSLNMPQLNDIADRFLVKNLDFVDLCNFVRDEIIPADRYFVLRNSLKELRETNYIVLIGLLPSVVFLMRAQSTLGDAGFPGSAPIRIAAAAVLFAAAYFVVSRIYKQTLKLPWFTTDATEQRVMIADHYRYLLCYETTIRRRNMVQKMFTIVYFLCFWNPSGYYG